MASVQFFHALILLILIHILFILIFLIIPINNKDYGNFKHSILYVIYKILLNIIEITVKIGDLPLPTLEKMRGCKPPDFNFYKN